MTTSENVIALYDECRHYRQMHRDIYGLQEYVDQLDFWTRREIEEFGRLLQLRDSSALLDIGCGLGGPACLLAGSFGAKVTGIDISDWHINEARLAAARLDLGGRVEFALADSRSFDSSGILFDGVIAIDSIVYMHPLDLLFENLSHMLKPAGKILLASECFDAHAPLDVVQERERAGAMKCIIESELEAALSAHGFAIQSVARDFERRPRFANSALRWMEHHHHSAGQENMTAILRACEKGGAFEILILANGGQTGATRNQH